MTDSTDLLGGVAVGKQILAGDVIPFFLSTVTRLLATVSSLTPTWPTHFGEPAFLAALAHVADIFAHLSAELGRCVVEHRSHPARTGTASRWTGGRRTRAG